MPPLEICATPSQQFESLKFLSSWLTDVNIVQQQAYDICAEEGAAVWHKVDFATFNLWVLTFENGAVRYLMPEEFEHYRSVQPRWSKATLPDLAHLECYTLEDDSPTRLAELESFYHQPAAGLYHCADINSLRLNSFEDVGQYQGRSVLLLLPDALATVADTFLDLWVPRQGYVPGNYLQDLFRPFGDAVLAYEYHALSQTPLDNTLQLVKTLPRDCELSLVAYGVGGVLAELLAQAVGSSFNDQDLQNYAVQASPASLQKLQALIDLVKVKRLRIKCCVNIAVPLRGLTAAQWPLSAALSLFYNVMQLRQQDYHQNQLEYLQALLVHSLCQPDKEAWQGWHDIRADSALMRLLNRPDVMLNSQQLALMGELEGRPLLQPWLQDWFPADFVVDDHDYIVNTAAMLGGAERDGGRYFYISCHRGSHHYHYLRDPMCLQRLLSATRDVEQDPQWSREVQAIDTTYRSDEGEPNRERGVVLFIPGWMGSALQVDEKPVWLDKKALHWGEFTDLNITNERVQVGEVIVDGLQAFFQQLSAQHEVVTYPYDWRHSHAAHVPALVALVERILQQRQQQTAQYPVRILAQGSGGLILLRLLQQRPLLWQRLRDEAQCRIVFLATPLRGLAAVWQLQRGEHRLIHLLDLLQGRADDKQVLVEQFAAYPGLQELLPTRDFSWLQTFPWDQERMLYVRGEAALTPMKPDAENAGHWLASTQGDGVVDWAVVPDNLPLWHLPVEHGRMLSETRYFKAILELLDRGYSGTLARINEREVVSNQVRMPALQSSIFPTMREVYAAASGYHTRQTRAEMLPPVELLLTHGNLEHCNRVLILGHYRGESVRGAESALNQRLGGRLREMHRLGVYPGPLDSTEVLLNQAKQPPGAIIIGLGDRGQLGLNELISSYTQGLLRYAMSRRDTLASEAKQRNPDCAYYPIELSTLLLGTLSNGLTLHESIIAMLRAVKRANTALKKLAGDQAFLRIQSLEVMELYEDKVIEAARHLQNLLNYSEFRDDFSLNSWVRHGLGGFSRVMYNESEGGWQRIQITASDEGLSFLALTDRARAESTLQATQRQLVDQFVSRAINNQYDSQCELGAVLFEMLLPNNFKNQAPAADRLVLVLDGEAAAYPWELLQNRRDTEQVPMAVRTGLIRQLQTRRFRETVVNPSERSALVVGDPQQSFLKRLPAAKQEAEAVVELLQRHEFSFLEREIDTAGSSILCALYAHDYRVLHLAGHGVFHYQRASGELVTGMVIGDDEFLTAVEIQQMRRVPEFVFINCCHLGQLNQVTSGATDDSALEQAASTERHQFAASFANALIAMGVRAAIVAGWAINDRAAKLFAETCYQSLLAGERFGDAVWRARHDTWQRYPEHNTWGAYQCYGDPDYRLMQARQDDLDDAEERMIAPRFMAQVEVLTELGNLINAADSSRLGEYHWLNKKLRTVHEVIPADWLNSAVIQERLGRAYGKLDQFPAAIAAYKRCLQAEQADFSLRMLEDLVSIQTAYALYIHLNEAAPERRDEFWQDQVSQLMSEALQTLNWLDDLGKVIPPMQGLMSGQVSLQTLDRLEERGKYWKRQAMILGAERAEIPLRNMQEAYWKGHEFARYQQRRIAPYPLLNWLTVSIVRVRRGESLLDEQGKAVLSQHLTLAEHEAQLRDQHVMSFCSGIALAEALLVRYLYPDLSHHTVTMQAISQAYDQALERGAPPRQIRFVSEHLDFLVLSLQGYYLDALEERSLNQLKAQLNERVHQQTKH